MTGFPFSVWKKITKHILTCANSDLFARGEAQGDYGLRLTISRYLHSSRGVNCRPEQVIVLPKAVSIIPRQTRNT